MGKSPGATRPKRRWLVLALIASGTITLLVVIVLSVLAALPTDVKKLSVALPPLSETAARAPRKGCALADVMGPGDTCAAPTVNHVREEKVSFASSIPEKGLKTLNGTLTLPDEPSLGPRPAIVILHGSGPNARDEVLPGDLVSRIHPPVPVLKELAEALAREGFIVLRWDKRACLHCYPDFDRTKIGSFRWSDYVQDARDAITYLDERPEVMRRGYVVAGHSEGGQLAPYVAEAEPTKVRAVMMLAGLTERFDVALLAQYQRFGDLRWGQGDVLGALEVWRQRSQFNGCFLRLAGTHDPLDGCVGGGVTLAMLADFLAYADRMPDVLARLSAPLFAIQGSVDRNIDPTEMTKLRALLAGKDHELHYVTGLNHALVDVVTPDTPPHVAESALAPMRTFLRSVGRP